MQAIASAGLAVGSMAQYVRNAVAAPGVHICAHASIVWMVVKCEVAFVFVPFVSHTVPQQGVHVNPSDNAFALPFLRRAAQHLTF